MLHFGHQLGQFAGMADHQRAVVRQCDLETLGLECAAEYNLVRSLRDVDKAARPDKPAANH